MIELVGYLGAVLLAGCGIPLLVATIRARHARGLDPWFLGMWLTGELALLAYVLVTGPSAPLVINYALNAAIVGVVSAFRWKD